MLFSHRLRLQVSPPLTLILTLAVWTSFVTSPVAARRAPSSGRNQKVSDSPAPPVPEEIRNSKSPLSAAPSLGLDRAKQTQPFPGVDASTMSPLASADMHAGRVRSLAEAYGKLPLQFEANSGQSDSQVKFLARGKGYGLFLTSTEAVFAFSKDQGQRKKIKASDSSSIPHPSKLSTLRMRLVGANSSVQPAGLVELAGKSNYFLGSDPAKWQTDVATYAKVKYSDVYPGIDMIYYGNQQQLEYDFVVAPGADPGAIRLKLASASKLHVDAHGDLILHCRTGDVRMRKPLMYQESEGSRHEIAGRYLLEGRHQVRFGVANYDRSKPLVIDPVLIYSTYLGGSSAEGFGGIAVDQAGNLYFAGDTGSIDFPTVNPIQPAANGFFAVVSKLNAAGSALIYSTYLGGINNFTFVAEQVGSGGIAIDGSGNVYVAGFTNANNFPTTTNAFQRTFAGGSDPFANYDVFLTRINAAGNALLYSTYLGGSDAEATRSIAADNNGNAWVTGATFSKNFPTRNAFQSQNAGKGDVFVSRLDTTQSGAASLVYSTYFGGAEDDTISDGPVRGIDTNAAIAVDPSGNAYIAGGTRSRNLPTMNAFQPAPGGVGFTNGFVAKFNGVGALAYCTYLGGGFNDYVSGIAVDAAGQVYVTGQAGSTDFPIKNALRPTRSNGVDGFITKLSASGSQLVFSTYLAGGGVNGNQMGQSISLDSSGNVYVAGQTDSTNFPTTNPVQATFGGTVDPFVMELNNTGTARVFSTYLGGGAQDIGSDVAVSGGGNIYVTGRTASLDFPTLNAFQPTNRGSFDNFITKIGVPSTTFSLTAIAPSKGGNTGTVTVTIHGSAFSEGATVKLVRAGQPDIVANPVMVGSLGLLIAASFNLNGKTPGLYDVVVTNPDGSSKTLAGSFTVEAGGEPQLYVDIVGRSLVRVGRQQSFQILYGNRGNIDAYGVPIKITLPNIVSWQPGFKVLTPSLPEGVPPIDFSQVPLDTRTDTQTIIHLIVPVIKAGSTGLLPLKLTVLNDNVFVDIEAQIGIPLIASSANLTGPPNQMTFNKCKSDPGGSGEPRRLGSTGVQQAADPGGCLQDLVSLTFNIINLVSPVPLPIARAERCASVVSSYLGVQTVSLAARQIGNGIAGASQEFTAATAQGLTIAAVSTATNCVLGFIPGVSQVLAGMGALIAATKALNDCFPPGGKARKRIGGVRATDPNDKIGAEGAGTPHYLSSERPLPYAIYFENLETATAPAQDVVITDQLDATKVDFNTFALGPIAFGSKQVIPPPDSSEFTTVVDLRPQKSLFVRINAGLDRNTGIVTWRFTSIDPATGQSTTDPTAGFLPPNKVPPEGDGNVLFTIMPKQGLATGIEIRNQARIVFDVNAPIDTLQSFNTIDNSKPASHVMPLTATQSSVHFPVQWSGTDTGSGIGNYTIFVSENGGPFTIWLDKTTATSGTFDGQAEKTYSFYSVAQDQTGNQEDNKTSGETSTTTPPPTFEPIVLTTNAVTLKTWTLSGHTFAYVKLIFPDAGFRVADFGSPVRSGSDFLADARVEDYTGASVQAVKTTAQIYDLGALTAGNYNFVFKNSGTVVKSLVFTVSSGPPAPNMIDDQRQFVRQQYLDFLSREPDGPGWDFWTDNITRCSDPARRPASQTEAQCIDRQRETTSAAFFVSPEFQNTGYFVLRVFLGSLNRMPFFGGSVPADNAKDEFTRDAARVSEGIVVNNNLSAAVIKANKQAFVNEFVTRPEFKAIYDGLNNAQYVDKLFQTTGVMPTDAERTALVNGLSTGGSETRASVLFKIVDGTQTLENGALVFQTRYGKAFYDQQFNPGFVQMEYFGFLKRDPDNPGFVFWLGKLNSFGTFLDAEMVKAFIVSPEYRSRFGQP